MNGVRKAAIWSIIFITPFWAEIWDYGGRQGEDELDSLAPPLDFSMRTSSQSLQNAVFWASEATLELAPKRMAVTRRYCNRVPLLLPGAYL